MEQSSIFKMESGYCYRYTGVPGRRWMSTPNDDWETEVYTPTGAEVSQGQRGIDGVSCIVFRCPDGNLRAQNRVNCCK